MPDPVQTNFSEELENASGTVHENLAGRIPSIASEGEIRTALAKGFDYRGDLAITLKSGENLKAMSLDAARTARHWRLKSAYDSKGWTR